MRRGLRRGRLGQCRRVDENSWLFEEVGRDGFVGLAKALCCLDLFWGCDVPHSREGNSRLFYPPDLPSLCIDIGDWNVLGTTVMPRSLGVLNHKQV